MCFFSLFFLSLSLDSTNYFRQAYVQLFFVLYLVTVMSRRESYSLPFAPKLVQPGPYMIYVISFLTVPEKKTDRDRLETESFNIQSSTLRRYLYGHLRLTLFIFVTLST